MPLKPDDAHDRIHEAGKQFQKAIQGMGMTNVAIFYVYTHDKKEIHDGYAADGVIHAIGACEYLKNTILSNEDD